MNELPAASNETPANVVAAPIITGRPALRSASYARSERSVPGMLRNECKTCTL